MSGIKIPSIPDLAEAITGNRSGKYYRDIISDTKQSPIREKEVDLMLRGLAATRVGLFAKEDEESIEDLLRYLQLASNLNRQIAEKISAISQEIGQRQGVEYDEVSALCKSTAGETLEGNPEEKGKGLSESNEKILIRGSQSERYVEISIQNYSIETHGKPYVARLSCVKGENGSKEVVREFLYFDKKKSVVGADGLILLRTWRIQDPKDGEIYEIRSGKTLPAYKAQDGSSRQATWWGEFSSASWAIEPFSSRKSAMRKLFSTC